MAPDQQPDDWADDLASLYIMEEIPAPPLTRSASVDEENLRILGSFVRPLPPEEADRQRSAYSGKGGYLTREALTLFMLEIDAGWT
jgi:hypothetical protein